MAKVSLNKRNSPGVIRVEEHHHQAMDETDAFNDDEGSFVYNYFRVKKLYHVRISNNN